MSRSEASEAVPAKSEVLGESALPPHPQNTPLSALKQALQGHNHPKGVKEAILGEIRRKEAQEGVESKSYNSDAFLGGIGYYGEDWA